MQRKLGNTVTFVRDDKTGEIGRCEKGVFSDSVEEERAAVDRDADTTGLSRKLVNELTKEEKDP
jgi:hypothetical protein